MKKRCSLPSLVLSVAVQLFVIGVAFGADGIRVSPEALAGLQFPTPHNTAEGAYLGLSGRKNFVFTDIRSEILLIEVFSMYCPICQAQAPVANQLFDMIESDSQTKGKIKIIGIGAGNTPFEVDLFKKKYDIRFPLFADDNMLIRKAASQDIRTPTFITLRPESGKNLSVLQTHVGKIADVKAFHAHLVGSLLPR